MHRASFPALGTTAVLLVTEEAVLAQAERMLRVDLDELDRACSRFRGDAELYRLVPGRSGVVSPLLRDALHAALWTAQATGGLVDPTVGEALLRLGYDRDFADVARTGPPAPPPVPAPGWWRVRLDGDRVLVPRGVTLDLGASAKAFAADRTARRVAARFGCGVLVSLGGDTAVAGEPPAGGWRIRVQAKTELPGARPDGPTQVVQIRDGGLATSSTTARRWRRGGDVLHHILDPRTCRPAKSVWRTVSVAAGNCADANTAATAAIIRGHAALNWLTSLRLPARLVEQNGTVHVLNAWPEG